MRGKIIIALTSVLLTNSLVAEVWHGRDMDGFCSFIWKKTFDKPPVKIFTANSHCRDGSVQEYQLQVQNCEVPMNDGRLVCINTIENDLTKTETRTYLGLQRSEILVQGTHEIGNQQYKWEAIIDYGDN